MTTALDASFKEGTVELSKDRIHYFEIGAGQPLVCIHGGGPGATGFSNFKQNAPGFAAQGNRVIMVDLPQYGKSSKPQIDGGRLAYYGSAMAEFAEAMELGRANWLGNSMGGGTSLRVAIDRPELVERLILMGSAGHAPSVLQPSPLEGIKLIGEYYQGTGPSLEKMERLIRTFLFNQDRVTPELLKERYEGSLDPEIVALQRSSRGGGLEDLTPELGKVQAPTLLIWGRDDRFVSIDAALGFLHRIPDARLFIFPRCGHWAQGEHPEEFNQVCLHFLQGSIGGIPS